MGGEKVNDGGNFGRHHNLWTSFRFDGRLHNSNKHILLYE